LIGCLSLSDSCGAEEVKSLPIIFVLMLGACSQQAEYEFNRMDQQRQCNSLPGSQREECLKHLPPDYQTYENLRRELLKESPKK